MGIKDENGTCFWILPCSKARGSVYSCSNKRNPCNLNASVKADSPECRHDLIELGSGKSKQGFPKVKCICDNRAKQPFAFCSTIHNHSLRPEAPWDFSLQFPVTR